MVDFVSTRVNFITRQKTSSVVDNPPNRIHCMIDSDYLIVTYLHHSHYKEWSGNSAKVFVLPFCSSLCNFVHGQGH